MPTSSMLEACTEIMTICDLDSAEHSVVDVHPSTGLIVNGVSWIKNNTTGNAVLGVIELDSALFDLAKAKAKALPENSSLTDAEVDALLEENGVETFIAPIIYPLHGSISFWEETK